MHPNSIKLMRYFRDKYLSDMGKASILDIGSKRVRRSHNTYRRLFPFPFQYLGMDLEPGRNVDIVGYENLPNFQFDVVISGQVMEHISYPWEWLESLKKYFEKYICIIAPSACAEHKHPIDTYRFMPDGMRALFNYAGIKEVEILKSASDTMGIGTK